MATRIVRKLRTNLFPDMLVLPRDAEIRAIAGNYAKDQLEVWYTSQAAGNYVPRIVQAIYQDHDAPEGNFMYIGMVLTAPEEVYDRAIHYYLECDP